MRIWLIAENWEPRVGGIERYLMGIAAHLKGHEVTVFAPTEIVAGTQDKPYVIRKRFSWKPLWPAWFPLYLSLAKKASKEKPDIIICGKALMEGRIARLLKKRYGIPYIVCTYGMEISTWKSRPRIKNQLMSVLQDAQTVLYINEQTKSELLELGVPKDRLRTLYPGIDPNSYGAPQDSEKAIARLGIQAPYILCVARLVKRKGVDDLIHAYAKLHNAPPLLIAGDGPEKKSLEKLAKKLDVQVKFAGAVSDSDLQALYSHAGLFALTPKELPGDYEGFGIVYLEAALHGLPVVGTKTGGVAGAVQDGVTGALAEPNNTESIAQALQRLVDNKALAKQYGQAGKERVLRKFTWDAIMKDFISFLATR